MQKRKDLNGQRFGKLTVESYSHYDTSYAKPRHMWNCKCECGNKKVVWTSNLTRNKVTTCGCGGKPNLVGQRFGHGVVIDKATQRKTNNRQEWILKCDCGNLYQATTSSLTAPKGKRTTSCKCMQNPRGKDSWHFTSEIEEISSTFWARIKKRSKAKNIPLTITKAEAYEIFENQNGKCIYSGLDLDFGSAYDINHGNPPTASLDRIDSSRGYEVGNVQWVHKHVNSMKNSYTEEYFIELCKAIVNNLKGGEL